MYWQTYHAMFIPSGNFEWESIGARMEVWWGHNGSLVGPKWKYGGDIVGI
jgi:hypothetical protein